MSNETDVQAAFHEVPRSQRPERRRLSWAQIATLIACIVCAIGLLAAVAEVARVQFSKGQSFSFADRVDPPTPEPYVSRGGTDLRELTLQAASPQWSSLGR